MGGKAKSRCRLGMLKVNKLYTYIGMAISMQWNFKKLGPTGECLTIILNLTKVVFFLFFTKMIQKV